MKLKSHLFFRKDDELLERCREISKAKLKIMLKNSSIVNLHSTRNIQKLKRNLIMEKSTQIFLIINTYRKF